MPEVKVATLTQIRDGIFKVEDAGANSGTARDDYDLKGIEYYVSVVANADGGTEQLALTILPLITPPRSRGMTRQGRNTVTEIMALETALGATADTTFDYHWLSTGP